jgi:glycosyltransferase involved in cell wall biosynthesis
MSKTTTIAAIIPLYNKTTFVAGALSSVLAQTNPVDEIIIVDDGSTDGSLKKIAPFICDPRVKVFHRTKPGPGGYAARNLAIRQATAQWVAFLDADDFWNAGFIEEIRRLIKSAPWNTGCVFTGHEKVWANGIVVRDRYSLRHRRDGVRSLSLEAFIKEWLAIGRSPIWTSACAIRRDILIKVGLFPEARCRLGGDKDTWLRVLAQSNALSSPYLGAVYQSITENQVTRLETFNCEPCVVASIKTLIPSARGRQVRLLRRLANMEIFEQALVASGEDQVRPNVYRGFHIGMNPWHYVIILGFARLPPQVRRLLRMSILRSRALALRLIEPGRIMQRK